MKKIFIVLGGVLLIALIGVWVYLMLYGTPDTSRDLFTQFEEGVDTETAPGTKTTGAPDVATADSPARLRQLTTKPVAGAVFTHDGVRYVEQGTGHIYDINLSDHTTTLISGTTLPQTTDAVFSPFGTHVIITRLQGSGTKTVLAELGTTTKETGVIGQIPLPDNATDIHISKTSVEYLVQQIDGSRGYRYDIQKGSASPLFTLPLRDVRILWGENRYAYTTPTAFQRGNVYAITDSQSLQYTMRGGHGLVAFPYEHGIIATYRDSDGIVSVAVTEDDTRIEQAFAVIPEKCVQDPLNKISIFCAVPVTLDDSTFPDDWYMGKRSYDDQLWKFNTETGNATSMFDFAAENGQPMDVRAIGTDEYGTRFYVIDKSDNTLWMFDRSI